MQFNRWLMKAIVLLKLLILLMAGGSSAQAYSDTVLVNRPESLNDKRYDYPHDLLQLVLDETQADYQKSTVKYATHIMNRERLLIALKEGDEVHVVAEAPKAAWVNELLLVRIPIRKGIQGYRLFFINKQDQATLSALKTFEEFKALATGSGRGWSTTRVLREAGFNVVVGNNYEGLFTMLERGRFQTFGRGVNEIEAEYLAQKEAHPNLAIDTELVLHIPLPTYFFISPKRPDLKKRIEQGLWRLIKSGKFEAYFLAQHQALIDKFRLKERRSFSIPNPNLSKADPLDNAELWLNF